MSTEIFGIIERRQEMAASQPCFLAVTRVPLGDVSEIRCSFQTEARLFLKKLTQVPPVGLGRRNDL